MLERIRRRQRLRYWALALPLLIIAATLPFLRPLRFPDPAQVSADESVRMAAIRAIALHGSLRLDTEKLGPNDTAVLQRRGEEEFGPPSLLPAQNPMLAVIGAGAYHAVRLSRPSHTADDVFGAYLLTLILATLPSAGTATLIYRCARLLELSRLKRSVLALAAVACTGLLPYGTVVSPHPMAAFLAAAALACVVQALLSNPPPLGGGWILLAGLFAGTASTVHLSTVAFSLALGISLLAMPWRRRLRVLSLTIFILGSVLPITVHRVLLLPYADEHHPTVWCVEQVLLPEPSEQNLVTNAARDLEVTESQPDVDPDAREEEEQEAHPRWQAITETVGAMVVRLLGPHGLLSHFPIVVLPLIGVAVIQFRYWPKATRALAIASLIGVLVPFVVSVLAPALPGEEMFGPSSLIPILPVFVLWTGVLIRPSWSGRSTTLSNPIIGWTLGGISLVISAIGLLHPYPRGGFDDYAPIKLLRQYLISPMTAVPPEAHSTTQPTTAPTTTPTTNPTTRP